MLACPSVSVSLPSAAPDRAAGSRRDASISDRARGGAGQGPRDLRRRPRRAAGTSRRTATPPLRCATSPACATSWPVGRRQAGAYLARPTDGRGRPAPVTATGTPDDARACTVAVCVHWVATHRRRAEPGRRERQPVPDFVDTTLATPWPSVHATLRRRRLPLAQGRTALPAATTRHATSTWLTSAHDGLYGYCTTDDSRARTFRYGRLGLLRAGQRLRRGRVPERHAA